MSLDIQIAPPTHGQLRVALQGRLDTHTFAQLDAALAPLLQAQPPPRAIVLDLGGLAYISSAGIRSIFKARKALSPHGGKVLVANPQPQIQKVFDLVKAVPLGDIFGSMAEADAYLDAMQRKVLEGDDAD